MQSQMVARQLQAIFPGLPIELKTIKTTADQLPDQPLADVGGKGLFSKELEQALLEKEIDFAVHSFKDLPVRMALVQRGDLTVAAVPEREDARDVLVCKTCRRLMDLPQGARVGTGSLRRRCQVLMRRPDVKVQHIRGNIDTRLGKLGKGEVDALILAMAGLRRSGLYDQRMMSVIDISELLPAAGQGALALQCRADDQATIEYLKAVNDRNSEVCVGVERALVAALGGDCHWPIAALARVSGEMIELRAAVGHRDGQPPTISAFGEAPLSESGRVVAAVYRSLSAQGVHKLLGDHLGE
jgi:hydroxymethylbilane synthase